MCCNMIYLDNAASTIMHQEVIQEMLPYFSEQYGNPSSIHRYGRKAHKAIQNAKLKISKLINSSPDEILLTSGGTESNNTVFSGILPSNNKNHIITSSIEHDAVLEPCKNLERSGFRVTYLPVDKHGMIDPQVLRESITPNTFLVSIMTANNEVGTIQPIETIGQICNENNILFHTDAIQAIGKIPLDVKKLKIDLLSISSHKINGPKGIGALFVKKGVSLRPLILGGGQEHGMRSGTENVANIVGFGKACEIAHQNLEKNYLHMHYLRDLLVENILKEIPMSRLNGHKEQRLPNNAHFTFLGINGEDLIIKLDENGIAASTGSACSVRIQKPSHVLKAMGFDHEEITGSLRLTVGVYNTKQEILDTVRILKNIVHELRKVSPFKEKYNFN